MSINSQQLRQHLQAFDFKHLFTEELNWVNPTGITIPPIELDKVMYTFRPIAESGGMIVAECQASDGTIPDDAHRKKIDAHATKVAFEHIIIFTDKSRTISRWRWVKHEKGQPDKVREHIYRQGQAGDLLMEKLSEIAFKLEELDEEGKVSIAMVTSRVARAFDVEKVTKKFFVQFQKEHDAFLEFLKGIQDIQGRDWYASVMLNRLMFLYFVQKKGFLNGDQNYLQTKLAESQTRGQDRFYRDFLLILFFEGLASEERTDAVRALLGNVPYLNGGLFLPHQIEEANSNIQLEDKAFERLFKFFDAWDWHLDDRPLHNDGEINPDVLGYIFEKYINQKQMGAYYTKEDITDYICKNTILPFLLDKIDLNVAQEIGSIDLYIYEAVSNEDHLPTETEREYTARRKRYDQIIADFAAGKISTVNDLITYNLDIRAFVEDWLRRLDAPIMLRRFYQALTELTVLDPTCGSGAFLFAAMNILEPLYDGCLKKMKEFLADPKIAFQFNDFKTELERVDQHPNRHYFVFKSIIINNLYGVDIMDEAIEICKLRLFLKLVSQIDDVRRIEPLPDIDFNIRAGNTLVGFATKNEIEYDLFARSTLPRIEVMAGTLKDFRKEQLRFDVGASRLKTLKASVRQVSTEISTILDKALMTQYGLDNPDAFRKSHKPFHWYAEFNRVMEDGGFDVIVGNPPYVEYSKVRKEYTIREYETESCGNLYANVMERSLRLMSSTGRFSMIVPVASVCSERALSLRQVFSKNASIAVSSYDTSPSRLFDVDQRLSIWICWKNSAKSIWVTKYHHWLANERISLFNRLEYTNCIQSELNSFGKIAQQIGGAILQKLYEHSRTIKRIRSAKPTRDFVFYQEASRYWVKCAIGLPFYEKNGVVQPLAHGRYLYWDESGHSKAAYALLNSSLFYFYFATWSDGFHLSEYTISSFPIAKHILSDKILSDLGAKLDTQIKANAVRKVIHTNQGQTIRYDEYQQAKSKPIIDEIDRVLAQHYGFTDEELDFIINYDIKYRMGKDADEGGDEA
ncbi:MAG: DNA methyltransferase [Chloroflexota bacterium]